MLGNRPINIYSGSLIIIVMMTVVTFVANMGSNLRYYFLFLCIVLTAFGITLAYSFEKMVNWYLKIMTFISVVGILGYYLVNNTNLLSFLPRMTNLNGVEYMVGVLFNSITIIPERNCGMFWEPGLFATYLVIALVFEIIYKNKKTSLCRIVIFSIGIFTANSSAGYVLLVLTYVLLLTRNKSKNNTKSIFMKVMQFSLFLLFIFLLINYEMIIYSTSLAENEYIQKLLLKNMKESTRVLAVQHNLEIFWRESFFWSWNINCFIQYKVCKRYINIDIFNEYIWSIGCELYNILDILNI